MMENDKTSSDLPHLAGKIEMHLPESQQILSMCQVLGGLFTHRLPLSIRVTDADLQCAMEESMGGCHMIVRLVQWDAFKLGFKYA